MPFHSIAILVKNLSFTRISMLGLLFIYSCLLMSSPLQAQPVRQSGTTREVPTSLTYYYNASGNAAPQAEAAFYSEITRDRKDTTLYDVVTTLTNGTSKATGSYKAVRFPTAWQQLHTLEFSDALKEGLHQTYHPGGELLFKGNFQNGLGEGTHRRYYASGQLLSVVRLEQGREEGKVTSYYENGNRQTEYEAQAGVLEGEFTQWDEQGKKRTSRTFSKGSPNGETIRYDDEGEPVPNP
jgi:antitoxin component YwqK of YwqJK toxin-antitoxin module